jgi:hypothetical protein
MNDDQFEQRLRNQPMRDVPADWQAQVLGVARAAGANERRELSREATFAATIKARLSNLLWPCPQAWAGLAAAWLLIFVINFAGRDESQPVAKKSPPPSPEMVAVLREQHRLLVELVGRTDPQDAEQPRVVPPRSERRVELLVA